ncbi:MAG TPA: hypothetical protein VEI02_01445 [Planctomycetota bacterium]|nr:hypothetical protein [Planctomycetota bacterium]
MPAAAHPRRSDEGLTVAAVALSVLLGVLMVAGVPDATTAPARGSAATSVPAGVQFDRLTSNNLKLGDPLLLDVTTAPSATTWLLASFGEGPTVIGGYVLALSPAWFVLRDATPADLSGKSSFQLPVPWDVGLLGLEFTVQTAVLRPWPPPITLSNPVSLKVGTTWTQGAVSVALVRQTATAAGLPDPAAQADALANALLFQGHDVAVFDDAIPADLRLYDVLFDCRFTTVPTQAEQETLTRFLVQNGGAFLLCGPWDACPEGQLRAYWITGYLAGVLGLNVGVFPGGTASGAGTEWVSGLSDPTYLGAAFPVAGIPFEVSQEGGHFGAPGAASVGSPWIVGPGPGGTVAYGMLFRAEAIAAETVGGRLAILFSGGPDALGGPGNPFASWAFENLARWLDR